MDKQNDYVNTNCVVWQQYTNGLPLTFTRICLFESIPQGFPDILPSILTYLALLSILLKHLLKWFQEYILSKLVSDVTEDIFGISICFNSPVKQPEHCQTKSEFCYFKFQKCRKKNIPL